MKRVWCLCLCLALLTGCGSGRSKTESVFAMDTVMELTAYGPKAQEALDAAKEEIDRLNALLDADGPNSDIARANGAGGESVTLAEESRELLEQALALCTDTDGALDVTIYPIMRLWGFDTKSYRVPEAEELAYLLNYVGYGAITLDGNQLTVPAGMELDLGAVGKGYAADRITKLWADLGVTSGLLNLGGNIQCLGAKPDGSDWVIGIRDPADEAATLCTVTGRDMAVVTSGSYQRYFEEDGKTYHHIMDPKTGRPSESGAASVSVIGASGLKCDALSTALFVMGQDRAAEYWRQRHDFDFIYYTQDGALLYTSGLEGRLTLREGLEGQMLTWNNENS